MLTKNRKRFQLFSSINLQNDLSNKSLLKDVIPTKPLLNTITALANGVNNIDARIIRYTSIIRIIFTRKNVKNKIEKEIKEKRKSRQIKKFNNYVFDQNIFLSNNGAIFISYENSKKDIEKILKVFKLGFKKFLS